MNTVLQVYVKQVARLSPLLSVSQLEYSKQWCHCISNYDLKYLLMSN